MKRFIRKILREQFEYKQQLFDLLRSGDSDNIEMVKMISQGQGIDIIELLIEYFKENGSPYFKILNHFDLSEDELNYVFSGIFGKPLFRTTNSGHSLHVYDENGYKIYYGNSDGFWWKKEYDENGNMIYNESSLGYWTKNEYNKNNHKIYSEYSNGYWENKEYAPNGNLIYYEDSNGSIEDNR